MMIPKPDKRYLRNIIIFMIIWTAIVASVASLIVRAPLWVMLIAVFSYMGVGALLGFIGWIIYRRYIYPQFGIVSQKLVVATKQASVAKEREMDVEYELNTDDALAFHLYNYEYSPQTGRLRKLMRRMLLFSIAIEILIAIVLIIAIGKDMLPFSVTLGILAMLTLLWWSFSPLLIRKSLRGAVARNYGQGRNKLTGKHKLSITPDAVTDIADMGESTTRWNAIEWVASTDEYLFMLVRASSPYIVPRRAFADDAAFRQFVEEAKAYHQAAMTQQQA
jgi:hypothetical protein